MRRPVTKIWSKEVDDLESFFKTVTLPAGPVKLNEWTTLVSLPAFVYSHIGTLKANDGKKTFLPFLNRLQQLKKILTIK